MNLKLVLGFCACSCFLLFVPVQAQEIVPPPTELPSRTPQEPEIKPQQPPDLQLPAPAAPKEWEGIQLDPLKTITVERFEVIGSTVFSKEDLMSVLAPFTGVPLTWNELTKARQAVTQKYIDRGYVSSFALFPLQEVKDGGVVVIQVVEGVLEKIEVEVKGRGLNPDYVRNRLQKTIGEGPLNLQRLEKAKQLLEMDPTIEEVNIELEANERNIFTSLLVQIKPISQFSAELLLDNNRTPLVGSLRRKVELTMSNLIGYADILTTAYSNSDGSDSFDLLFSLPITNTNGRLGIIYSQSWNEVVEDPFSRLDIKTDSRYGSLSFRQPIIQTLREELTVGATLDFGESQSSLLGEPVQLSFGADEEGRIRVSALRLLLLWTKQSDPQQVFQIGSELSMGLPIFGATLNEDAPDSRFFSWRSQAIWKRSLSEDILLVARVALQLADTSLVSQEQFSLGGLDSVRGYRVDELSIDNGLFGSLELRFAIFQTPNQKLEIVPFIDVGAGWNNPGRPTPESNTLVSTGLGLRYQVSDRLSARFDWGVPLLSLERENEKTWQDQGIHFSVIWKPF